jgi:GNAT superfamily N-acetyltransferase
MNKRDQLDSISFREDELIFKPVTPNQWVDLENLFSEHGIQNGCWCMYWRIPRKECQRNYGEGNKLFLKQLVDSGKVPGILAYHKRKPVGWCSVAPREDFPVVLRSPTLKPVDNLPVWSIVCFFVSKPYRNSGLTHLLIKAAIEYAKENGAHIVEAYPIDIREKHIEYERYSGLTTTYGKEGFQEALRRSKRRPIMRYYVLQNSKITK